MKSYNVKSNCKKLHSGLSITLLLAAMTAATTAQAAAGFIQFVSGEARVILAKGGERAAQKGFELNEGDTVVTNRGSTVQLRMTDEGLIAIRADTELKIETYQYFGREDGSERGILALARGGFRTLTGFIGRNNKQNYMVRAPSATIGIRGTDHEIVHIPLPVPGETPIGIPGTYNKVNVGETYMETRAGRLELGPNQVGFAALVAGTSPVRLDAVPPFLRATPQQQGRDDRRQGRESSPNDQRRIAQQAGQPGQGSPAPRPGSAAQPGTQQGQQQPGQQQPGQQQPSQQLAGFQQQPAMLQQPGFQQQGQIQPTAFPVNTVDNGISISTATQSLVKAPGGYVGVGGDFSLSTGLGSGAVIQGDSGNIFYGQDGQMAMISRPTNGFSYARSGASNIAPGGLIFLDGAAQIPVQWGIYAGGGIVDSSGSRAVKFFQFMTAQGSPLAVANTLTGTYTSVVGHTSPINENGLIGGSVTAANISVNAGQLTAYSVQALDGQARTWFGSCQACSGGVLLATFASSGVALAGTGAGGVAAGKAQGAPIGPNGGGFVSSFNLKTAAGQGIAASFVIK